jgi:hypothetical protein
VAIYFDLKMIMLKNLLVKIVAKAKGFKTGSTLAILSRRTMA